MEVSVALSVSFCFLYMKFSLLVIWDRLIGAMVVNGLEGRGEQRYGMRGPWGDVGDGGGCDEDVMRF
jgi:hypothetical protein